MNLKKYYYIYKNIYLLQKKNYDKNEGGQPKIRYINEMLNNKEIEGGHPRRFKYKNVMLTDDERSKIINKFREMVLIIEANIQRNNEANNEANEFKKLLVEFTNTFIHLLNKNKITISKELYYVMFDEEKQQELESSLEPQFQEIKNNYKIGGLFYVEFYLRLFDFIYRREFEIDYGHSQRFEHINRNLVLLRRTQIKKLKKNKQSQIQQSQIQQLEEKNKIILKNNKKSKQQKKQNTKQDTEKNFNDLMQEFTINPNEQKLFDFNDFNGKKLDDNTLKVYQLLKKHRIEKLKKNIYLNKKKTPEDKNSGESCQRRFNAVFASGSVISISNRYFMNDNNNNHYLSIFVLFKTHYKNAKTNIIDTGCKFLIKINLYLNNNKLDLKLICFNDEKIDNYSEEEDLNVHQVFADNNNIKYIKPFFNSIFEQDNNNILLTTNNINSQEIIQEIYKNEEILLQQYEEMENGGTNINEIEEIKNGDTNINEIEEIKNGDTNINEIDIIDIDIDEDNTINGIDITDKENIIYEFISHIFSFNFSKKDVSKNNHTLEVLILMLKDISLMLAYAFNEKNLEEHITEVRNSMNDFYIKQNHTLEEDDEILKQFIRKYIMDNFINKLRESFKHFNKNIINLCNITDSYYRDTYLKPK